MSRQLKFAIILAALTMIPSYAVSQALVVTNMGFFPSCQDAIKFRDNQLANMLKHKFSSYDNQREENIKALIDKYNTIRKKAVAERVKLDESQSKIVKVALTQIAVALALEHTTALGIAKLKGSPPEKATLQAVLDGTNGLVVDFGASLAQDKAPDGTLIVIARVKTLSDAIINAANQNLLPPQLILASKVYTVSSVAIPSTADWIDAQLDKTAAKTVGDIAQEAVTKMLNKSDATAIKEINDTKAQIDKACAKS